MFDFKKLLISSRSDKYIWLICYSAITSLASLTNLANVVKNWQKIN